MRDALTHRPARVQSILPSETGLHDYGIALGVASAQLHPAVWRLHCVGSCTRASGRFEVRRGGSVMARVLATLLRLPVGGIEVPLTLTINRGVDGEVWRRDLGGRPLMTRQRVQARGIIEEQIGPIILTLTVGAADGMLVIGHAGTAVRLGGRRLRVPRWASPRVAATAAAADDVGVAVRVRVSLPRGGLLLSYSGTVKEVQAL